MKDKENKRLVPELRFSEFKDDWNLGVLKELSHKIMVGIASSATHAYRDKGIILFRNQNIKEGFLDDNNILFIDEEYEKKHKNKRLKGGDLLTARTGYPGTTCVLPKRHEGSQSFTTLITRPNKNIIDSFYVCFYINSESGQAFFESTKIGGGQKNVNAGSLSEMPIPFPSPQEQQKIAHTLTSLDELIAAEQEKREALFAHKKGLLQQLFPAKGEKLPKVRFGEFRGEWEEKQIENACEKPFSGGTPRSSNDNYYGGDIPFIRSAEINKDKTELFLTESGYDNSSAKMVKKGDVLIALYGANSGDVAISKIDGAINQAILCLRSKTSNEFLHQYLTFKKDWIISTYLQGGQGNLSGKIVKSVELYFPRDPEEQQKIANCLSSLDDLIAAQSEKIDALQAHKKGLMQGLFPVV